MDSKKTERERKTKLNGLTLKQTGYSATSLGARNLTLKTALPTQHLHVSSPSLLTISAGSRAGGNRGNVDDTDITHTHGVSIRILRSPQVPKPFIYSSFDTDAVTGSLWPKIKVSVDVIFKRK